MSNTIDRLKEIALDPEVQRVDALTIDTEATLRTILAQPEAPSLDIRERALKVIATTFSSYRATNRNKVAMARNLRISEALKNTYLDALNECRSERDMLREELEALKGTNLKAEEL